MSNYNSMYTTFQRFRSVRLFPHEFNTFIQQYFVFTKMLSSTTDNTDYLTLIINRNVPCDHRCTMVLP